ncbi:MAG: YitT family protein [Alkaliphilus sp.]|nr:YitT family protein [Alkaliphilus sp.]
MKKRDYKKLAIDGLYIILGCMILAFAITAILKPNGLTTGGVTGFSFIIDKMFGINYTYIYYLVSTIILTITWIVFGKREGMKILLLSILFPSILVLFENLSIQFIENDTILASIYYGILGGAGCGLILKRGYSFGGTDTIAKMLHYKLFPFISISQILLGIDVVIIAVSGLIYDRNVALYGILTQIIFIKAIDLVLFGFGSKNVKIEIISNENDLIIEYILNSLKRGISSYEIQGGYTNIKRQKIACVCSPREAMLVKMFIAKIDSDAFVDVIPVVSVWGKGMGFESLLDESMVLPK